MDTRTIANNASTATLIGRAGFGERNDCAVRAIAVVAGLPYAEAHAVFAKHGRVPGRGTPWPTMEAVAKELGLVRVEIGRRTWAQQARLSCNSTEPRAYYKRGHLFAAIGRHVADFAGATPRQVVRFYYIKKPA